MAHRFTPSGHPSCDLGFWGRLFIPGPRFFVDIKAKDFLCFN